MACFFPFTATIEATRAAPPVTIDPMAAYSAHIEQGAEPLTSMFTPSKILPSTVLSTEATVVLVDLLFLAS